MGFLLHRAKQKVSSNHFFRSSSSPCCLQRAEPVTFPSWQRKTSRNTGQRVALSPLRAPSCLDAVALSTPHSSCSERGASPNAPGRQKAPYFRSCLMQLALRRRKPEECRQAI